ncbi:hypothetical protein QOZ80_5AG0386880 [Eleusine coracana subsp. coracana]|nr:hypothetical protein QOZ80_5AG0386880 [Eleusine coracana subsp. coracana]
MDDYFYQALVLSVLAVVLLQLVKLALRPAAPRLPLGPWQLPIIGSMHHLVNVLPHRALQDLAARYGPLMLLRFGQIPLVVVSSKETARDVLRTHNTNFATRPKLLAGEIVGYEWVDILFAPSGEYWRKLRQLCAAEILNPKRVLSFRRIREDEVNTTHACNLFAVMLRVNLSVMFHSITNSIVSRAAFGKKRKNAPEFLAATKAVVGLSSGFNIPDLFPAWTTVLARLTGMTRSLKDIHKTVDTILQEIIDERKTIRDYKIKNGQIENVDENLVDVLIGLQEKGEFGFDLTNTIIKAIILDMFAGGTGTSASAMEWGMSELMWNPMVMKELQGQLREAFRGKEVIMEADLQASNLRYLKLVIKEALWLAPACAVTGAEGEHPGLPVERFMPERFEDGAIDFTGSSYEFLPFGSGRRMCPGFHYGLASMELTFAGLLYYFDWSLPEGVNEVDMEEAPGLGVRRRSPLILCVTPFVPDTNSAG